MVKKIIPLLAASLCFASHQVEELVAAQPKKEKEIDLLRSVVANQRQEIDFLSAELNRPEAQKPSIKKQNQNEIFNWRPDTHEAAFFAAGDFLYWRTLMSPTDYAIKDQIRASNTGAVGDYLNAEYDWNPGLRLNVGYRFKPYFWEMDATYTYFHNSGSDSHQGAVDSDRIIVVGTITQTTNALVSRASSHLDINFHLLDILLARRILLNEDFIFRFFTGVTAAWIDQDFDIKYFSSVNDVKIDFSFDYDGWGIKTGVSSDWYIGKGLSLFGKLSFAGLAGSYDNRQTTKVLQPSGLEVTQRDGKVDETWFAFNTQFMFGPRWGLQRDTWGISLFAAYEINPWFNLHMIRRVHSQGSVQGSESSLPTKGLICPQGLTLNLTLTF